MRAWHPWGGSCYIRRQGPPGSTATGTPVTIRSLREQREGDLSRVTVTVDGHEIYFESAEASLLPSPEAVGSAMVLPAQLAGRSLGLDDPLDGPWLDGVQRLQAIVGSWWGREPRPIHATTGPPGRPRDGAGLCFSGGVDSFYSLFSLLRASSPPQVLVAVIGYDMTLHDAPRVEAFERMVRAVAKETGARPVFVRTNLREHPLVAGAHWERCFGGALAAVGHLLAGEVGRLIMPASFPAAFSVPYGTHQRIDALWSSSRSTVEGHGDDHWRMDKLRAVAQEPLVQEHLRVCWENRTAHGNCSRCEKCLRTILTIEALGLRSVFSCFDCVTPFAELVAEYVPTGGVLAPAFEVELGRGLPPDVAQAVRELAARSLSLRHMLDKRVGGRPGRRSWLRRR